MNIDRTSPLDLADRHDHRLEVKDFGPIEHAEVEFRPLTVFVGPSNTGKSYLATLSYAMHRHFATEAGRQSYGLGRLARALDQMVRDRGSAVAATADMPAELATWTAAVAPGVDLPVLPPAVAEAVRAEVERDDRLAASLGSELTRSFGTDGFGELVRRSGSGAAEVRIAPSRPVAMGLLAYRMRLAGDQMEVQGRALESTDPLVGARPSSPAARRWIGLMRREALRYQYLESDGFVDERARALRLGRIIRLLIDAARHPVVGPMKRLPHYLPADRTGIMHSHRAILAALVQSAAMAGMRRAPKLPLLSGVAADFLGELVALPDSRGRRSENRIGEHVARQLEDVALGGKVRVEASPSGYPSFLYRPCGWSDELPITRSSSMVSELAPLVLYLRHVVERGNVLIIDEPESHLHPGIQVEVMRQLAHVVRAGVRVILTTHSEWVLEELSNLVLASQLPEEKRREVAHSAPELSSEEVGVWLFSRDEGRGGSVVSEMTLEESTLFSSSFDNVAASTYNRWAAISDLLGGAQ